MPNPTESQIKDRIAEFVQELDLLVRKSTLDALRSVLDGRAAPARRGRPAGSGRGPGRPKGSGNVEEAAAKLVAHVQANDGQNVGQIAQATGVASKVAKKVIIKLLSSGALKKSGQKRGTVYHVGSGKKPRAKVKKAGKRGGRKAKPKKKATKKPVLKKAFVIPARKRLVPSTKPVAPRPQALADVPQALAV